MSACGALAVGLPVAAFAGPAPDPANCAAADYIGLENCFGVINTAGHGTVHLTADITESSSTLALTGSAWLTLDLAGHHLTLTGDGGSTAPAIGVPAGTALTIEDTAADGGGELDATGALVNFGTASGDNLSASAAGIGTAGATSASASGDSGLVVVESGTVDALGGAVTMKGMPLMSQKNYGGSGAGIGTGGAATGDSGVSGPVLVRGGDVYAESGPVTVLLDPQKDNYAGAGAGVGSGGSSGDTGDYGRIAKIDAGSLSGMAGEVIATGGNHAGTTEDLGAGGTSSDGHGDFDGVYAADFDSAGGSAVRPEESDADSGLFAEPVAPTREGYDFEGWYTSPTTQDNTTKFDFSTAVSASQVLYAGWQSAKSDFTASAVPTISGAARAGSTLTLSDGPWDPAASLSHQWYADGVAIGGATGTTLALTNDLAGKVITVKTTGSASGYNDKTETSAATAAVQGALTAGSASITGEAVKGEVLTAHTGTWSPAASSYDYQWYADGVLIAGATGSTFTPTGAQLNKVITVQVTGHKSGYDDATGTASAATSEVLNVFSTSPVPTVSGTPEVGQTLTATPGTWVPAATSLAYQWFADGVAIDGANASTYTLTTSEAGHQITVQTTGARSAYKPVTQESLPTAAVTGEFAIVPTPTITGTAVKGGLLTANVGTWAPEATTYGYQWYADGQPIVGATDPTYAPTSADLEKAITVRVTGHRSGYVDATTDASTATDDVLNVFSLTPAPTVSGVATAGHTLTAAVANWSPTASYSYQWLADGVAIDGATESTFTLTDDQAGARVTVQVTGARTGYESVAEESAPTDVVSGVFTTAAKPTITGDAVVGSTLSADAGTWSPSTDSVDFQWFADGIAISGATHSTLTLAAGQAGAVITVEATGHKAGYADATSDASAATAAVLDVFTSAPVPTISGTPTVGQTLTADAGTWAPVPDSIGFQWYAGDVAIPGATDPSFTVTSAQDGKAITVRATGIKAGFKQVAQTSAATDAVVDVFSTVAKPTITGDAVVGSTLSADPGAWSPSTDSVDFQWFADGVAIEGATHSTLTLAAGQAGAVITVEATGHKAGYADATSDASGATSAVLNVFTAAPAPIITGAAKVGAALSVSEPQWDPAATMTYQWYADGVAIAGATGTSFTPAAAQLGKTITVRATGARQGYVDTVKESAATAQVARGDWAKTSETKMTGSSAVGGTLTARDPGTTVEADSYTYQWYAAGKPVKGATGKAFDCVKKYAGKRMSVKVTAVKAGYPDIVSVTGGSHPVGTFWRNEAPQISGTVAVGSTVTAVVDASGWAPTPTSFSYSWWIDGKPVKGATKSTYRIPARYKGHQLAVHVTAKRVGYPLQTERFSPRSTIK